MAKKSEAPTVNGFQIQNKIKLARLASEAAYENFTKNILQFESHEREDLDKLYDEYVQAEHKVARLQTLQDFYNCTVRVSVKGKEMALSEVINHVGGAGRAAKLWRLASKGSTEVSRYSRLMSTEVVRDKDKDYATRAKPQAHCMSKLYAAEESASLYREALSTGNLTAITADGVEDILT